MKKVVLITGSTRGIGKAIAKKMANDGHDIIVNGTKPESEVRNILSEISFGTTSEIIYCQADISLANDRESIVNLIEKHFKKIDVLINNAGVAPKNRADILELGEESYERVMDINLKGPFFLTQAISRFMISDQKLAKDQNAMIINISSISAYTSSPIRSEYCLSKAGMAMMTKLYADRLAEYGINVYEIRPGIIATDMTSGVKAKYDDLIAKGLTPIKRWGKPDDIANAVSALVEGYFRFSTGEVFNVDGGFCLERL